MFSHYDGYEEYLRHPVFRAARACAMRRARGRCERCGQVPPTEVHHVRYPLWGAFDTADNLQAVCHGCHCEIENKPA